MSCLRGAVSIAGGVIVFKNWSLGKESHLRSLSTTALQAALALYEYTLGMAPVEGIEPSTRGFGGRRSTTELHRCNGLDGGTRTHDLRTPNAALYHLSYAQTDDARGSVTNIGKVDGSVERSLNQYIP